MQLLNSTYFILNQFKNNKCRVSFAVEYINLVLGICHLEGAICRYCAVRISSLSVACYFPRPALKLWSLATLKNFIQKCPSGALEMSKVYLYFKFKTLYFKKTKQLIKI